MTLDETDRKALGAYLKVCAQVRGLTQSQLSTQVEIPRSTISRVYQGKLQGDDHYKHLAKVFSMTLGEALTRARTPDEVTQTQDPPRDLRALRSGALGAEAVVITVGIEKGGAGKTTTAVNLASVFAEFGHQVLLVDLDTQGTASRHVGFGTEGGQGLHQACRSPEDAPLTPETTPFGFDLVRGGRALGTLDSTFHEKPVNVSVFRKTLAPLLPRYDLILIDTPPTLGVVTSNAMVASRYVLVPVQTEGAALDGLDQIERTIQGLRELNPLLDVLGAVPVMYDGRTALSNYALEALSARAWLRPTETRIPRNVTLGEAYIAEEPVNVYESGSRGAKAYRALATELLGRMIHG